MAFVIKAIFKKKNSNIQNNTNVYISFYGYKIDLILFNPENIFSRSDSQIYIFDSFFFKKNELIGV